MDFPADNCHAYPNGPSTCTYGRFGNGTWDQAGYAQTNYTYTNSDGTVIDGSFFDFPESLTRYEYYLREIERAARGGDMENLYDTSTCGGASPADQAIDQSSEDMNSMPGATAVILVGDGEYRQSGRCGV